MSNHRILLALLLAITLVRGVLYTSLIPPWQVPDEPAQFERARAALSTADWANTPQNRPHWYPDLAKLLFEFGFWDHIPEPRPAAMDRPLAEYIDLYHDVYGGLYGSRPAFFALGWPALLAPNADLIIQLYLMRLWTVLLNVAIVALAFLLTKTIFPHDRFLQFGVPLLIVFNPQHTHMQAAVYNGSLAELLSLAALWLMVSTVINGFGWLKLAATLLLALLAMYSKATAYFLLGVLPLFALFLLWPYRRRWPWIFPIVLLVVGGGWLAAPERITVLFAEGWSWASSSGFNLNPVVPRVMFGSFWALLGWLSLQLDRFWYLLLMLVVGGSGVGLALLMVRHARKLLAPRYRPQVKALALLVVAVAVAVAIPLLWSGITGTVTYRQGRSIYPVIAPLYLFFLLGWRQLIPAGWRPVGMLAITAALFLFDGLVLIYYAVPFFYSV